MEKDKQIYERAGGVSSVLNLAFRLISRTRIGGVSMHQDPSLADAASYASSQKRSSRGAVSKILGALIPLKHIRSICNSHKRALKAINKKLAKLISLHGEETQQVRQCLEITAECQKQTAQCANSVFERHALHPAVETLFLLNRELQELHGLSQSLDDGKSHCPMVASFVKSVAEAAKIADEKCAYLDVQTICPETMDEFNPNQCEVVQAVPTGDKGKHRKVNQTLKVGLSYRGKVLTKAKVSLFKHNS